MIVSLFVNVAAENVTRLTDLASALLALPDETVKKHAPWERLGSTVDNSAIVAGENHATPLLDHVSVLQVPPDQIVTKHVTRVHME